MTAPERRYPQFEDWTRRENGTYAHVDGLASIAEESFRGRTMCVIRLDGVKVGQAWGVKQAIQWLQRRGLVM